MRIFITCIIAVVLMLSGCGSDRNKQKAKKEPQTKSQQREAQANEKSGEGQHPDERDPREQIRNQFRQ